MKSLLVLSLIGLLAMTSVQAASAPKGFEVLQGIVAPKTQFSDARGQPITIDAFKGKVVILNFWATWCGPCIKEMPSLDRLSARLNKDTAEVVAVSQDKGGAAIAKPFIERLGVENLVAYADPSGKLSRDLGVRGLPTTFIIAPDGTVATRVEGPVEWDTDEILSHLATIGRF